MARAFGLRSDAWAGLAIGLWASGLAAAVAPALAFGAVPRDSTAADTLRMTPPVVVRARRPDRQEVLDRLPGAATVVELEPLRDRITTTAEVLEHVPGVRVHDYGSLGGFSTVSIRGSGSNQVSVYLDGMPLVRAGLGIANLADLPFAAVERIEVYRGFVPSEFPGASIGGAINLVTRAVAPGGPPQHGHSLLYGDGSFGTRRFGTAVEGAAAGWSGLVVADVLESDGDFRFHDDNGTPLEPADDETVARRNNWMRHDEVLLRVARALPRRGEARFANQWVRRADGVPGISSFQSHSAHADAMWNVTSADLRAPRLCGERLELRAHADYQWRRDTFSDLQSEIGLGYQDNRDVTRGWGSHAAARAALPGSLSLAVDVDWRHERFEPWRGFPTPGGPGPLQRRTRLACGGDARLEVLGRLALHGGLRGASPSSWATPWRRR